MRVLRLGMGYLWAACLLLSGMWLWGQQATLEADVPNELIWLGTVWTITAAQLVFMVLVADDLCPVMPMVFIGFLKRVTGILWWGVLLCGAWLVWGLFY